MQAPNTVQKAIIHQVTTMLATSKSVLFPGPNHQYWWPKIWFDTRVIIKVKGH